MAQQPEVTGIYYQPGYFDEVWCQVTMLNAQHGDSNLIDLNLGEGCDFKDNFRILIDTGTFSKQWQDLLKSVLLNVYTPFAAGTPIPPVPDVNVVQITHIDEDHAGNAIPLIEMLQQDQILRQKFKGAAFSFVELLDATPQFEIALPDGDPDNIWLQPGTTTFNFLCQELEPAENWLAKAWELGFYPQYSFVWDCFPNLNAVDKVIRENDLKGADIGPRLKGEDIPGATIVLGNDVTGSGEFNFNLQNLAADHPYVLISCYIRFFKESKLAGARSRATGYDPVRMNIYHDTIIADDSKSKKAWEAKLNKDVQPIVEFQTTRVFKVVSHDAQGSGWHSVHRLKWEHGDIRIKPREWVPGKTGLKSTAIYHRLPSLLKQLTQLYPSIMPNHLFWPKEGQQYWNKKKYPLASAIIRGPTESTFRELRRAALTTAFENLLHATKSVDWGVDDSGIANRASLITLFERYTKIPNPEGELLEKIKRLSFTMLFTGDAHDKHCNVRDTIIPWAGYNPIYLDVLKVPHHGSDVTADSEFYRQIRAQVYLICGRQSKHGSPSLSALKTIVETMEDRMDRVHYLFFSDPDSLEPVIVEDQPHTSNVSQLLRGYPPYTYISNPDHYFAGRYTPKYRCFRLVKGVDGKNVNKGTIVCGSLHGVFKIAWWDAEWIEMKTADAKYVN